MEFNLVGLVELRKKAVYRVLQGASLLACSLACLLGCLLRACSGEKLPKSYSTRIFLYHRKKGGVYLDLKKGVYLPNKTHPEDTGSLVKGARVRKAQPRAPSETSLGLGPEAPKTRSRQCTEHRWFRQVQTASERNNTELIHWLPLTDRANGGGGLRVLSRATLGSCVVFGVRVPLIQLCLLCLKLPALASPFRAPEAKNP